MEKGITFVVSLDASSDVPQHKLDDLTIKLLRNMKTIDGISVKRMENKEQEPGSKDLITLNTFIVTAISAGAVTAIIEVLKEWISRKAARTVTLKIQRDNKSIETIMPVDHEEQVIALADKLVKLLHVPDPREEQSPDKSQ